MISQRTKEGLEAARARGRVGGRPKIDQDKIKKALTLYESKNYSIPEILKETGISKSSLYRVIKLK